MSNASFQERLQRINAKAQPAPVAKPSGGRQGPGKAGYIRIAVAGAVMMFGVQLLKFVNAKYEAMREDQAGGLIVGISVAGIVILLAGGAMVLRACSKSDFAPARPPKSLAPVERRPSKATSVIYSLLGFAFGSAASFYLAIASTARHYKTEHALLIVNGSNLIVLALIALSLLIGIIGFFVRGRGLWRVPTYFMFGLILTFSALRLMNVNLHNWDSVVAELR